MSQDTGLLSSGSASGNSGASKALQGTVEEDGLDRPGDCAQRVVACTMFKIQWRYALFGFVCEC